MNNHILLALLINLTLITGCSDPEAPLDTQPKNLSEARSLAKTIAWHAECTSFEDQHFNEKIIFSCQKQIDGEDSLFNIYVFQDASAKALMRKELGSRPFKEGAWFIISRSRPYSDGADLEPDPVSGYAGFPGQLVLP